MNLFGLAIPRHVIRQTRLHAADHHHQTLGNPIPLRDLLRQLPFIHLAGIQILVRPSRLGGSAQSGLLDLLGETGGKFAKVLDQDPTDAQIGFHHLRAEQMSQGTPQTEAIKTLQGPLNEGLVFAQKGRRDTRLGGWDEACIHPVIYAQKFVSCHSENKRDPARLSRTGKMR